MKVNSNKLNSLLNIANNRVEAIAKSSKPFKEGEIFGLKSIVNDKWQTMADKVDGLRQEVFNEVVEHEMALAKLETFNFE